MDYRLFPGFPSYDPSKERNDQVKGHASKIDQVKGYVSNIDQLQCIRIAVDRFINKFIQSTFQSCNYT